jgi:hydroxymethylbilane synthase
MNRVVRIGTRGSALALAQARLVAQWLQSRYPEIVVEQVIIKTTGDRFVDRPLRSLGGKGVFVKEIEDALIANAVDCAVHSMKDVPSDLAPGLVIAAIPARAAAHDVLISRGAHALHQLPAGTRVGTSSLRRMALLRTARPDAQVVPLRGNVDTRLRKLDAGELDAVILAAAGLQRLGIEHAGAVRLPMDSFLPAIGQGALAIETRDDSSVALFAPFNDSSAAIAVAAERAFLRRVGGSCQTPLAAHATLDAAVLTLRALIASVDGTEVVGGERVGPSTAAVEVGQALADELLERGGRDILAALSEDGNAG